VVMAMADELTLQGKAIKMTTRMTQPDENRGARYTVHGVRQKRKKSE